MDATPVKVKVPKALARLLDEANALTEKELAEYAEQLEEMYANEFELGKVGPETMRLFALSWHKMNRIVPKLKESRDLHKAGKRRQSNVALAVALRYKREYEYLPDVAIGNIEVECDAWRFGSLDGVWIRKGGIAVSSRIDITAVTTDGSADDEGEDDEDLHTYDPDDPQENGSEPTRDSSPKKDTRH